MPRTNLLSWALTTAVCGWVGGGGGGGVGGWVVFHNRFSTMDTRIMVFTGGARFGVKKIWFSGSGLAWKSKNIVFIITIRFGGAKVCFFLAGARFAIGNVSFHSRARSGG